MCRLLQISRNTLNLWLKKDKETGDIRPKKPGQKEAAAKIKDEEKFREFIRENSDKTQQQIAELWGENLTQHNVSYACHKLDITRKKNL